jgi:hypothetical protein
MDAKPQILPATLSGVCGGNPRNCAHAVRKCGAGKISAFGTLIALSVSMFLRMKKS